MSAAIAAIGHNQPPADAPTPFDLSKEEIEGLVVEARNWLDGSGVKSEADEKAISKLIDMLRKAGAVAEERRKAEAKPFDDGKAEVQARYNPLIQKDRGIVDIAIKTAKAALKPWLDAKEAAIEAAAAEARRIADEQAAAAVEAIRAARQGEPDLEARETAEAMLVQAKHAEADARRAEKTKAHATGGTRAIGLRSVWRGEIADAREFAKWVWSNRNDELLAFMAGIVKSEVTSGARSLPGVSIVEERVL